MQTLIEEPEIRSAVAALGKQLANEYRGEPLTALGQQAERDELSKGKSAGSAGVRAEGGHSVAGNVGGLNRTEPEISPRHRFSARITSRHVSRRQLRPNPPFDGVH